ncbi:MAG: tRNA dimethylallyltransferase [candidate division WS6 bacterium GW2011_GWA2_37_6]|uniref:tRNA dimethylallyltransferase n=1 Tax=candidate division WS6 bacterium GW2011_GWA2_37_6 TaxID=1619087 RepID=A0A0G0H826_9BACT|nr:MAG: tRNA dimethylallyltransferase [candidate division WS6 bacterium GW2011_GWA2_37_6]
MKGEQINSKTLIVMGGPTASGKTDLAIKVAQNFNGEIINADSMQVYQDMDIGTNKGHVHPLRSIWNDSQIKPIKDKIEDREFVLKPYEINNSGVIGWLFNIVKPDYNFTVSEYQKLAYTIIDSIHQRGKVPVLVGGTGLYIDAVIKGYRIHSRPDLKLREKLNTLTVIELQEEIKKLDYNLEKLNNSDRNNPRRLIRLAEKLFADRNGKNKKNTNKVEKGFNVIFLYSDIEKEEIFSNIEKRAELKRSKSFLHKGIRLKIKLYNQLATSKFPNI